MKKIILAVIAIMMLGLTACSAEKDAAKTTSTGENVENVESTDSDNAESESTENLVNSDLAEIPDGLEVIDTCIDYVEYKGQKFYLTNDLVAFLQQFEETDYVCTSRRDEIELNEEFYAELESMDGFLVLTLQTKITSVSPTYTIYRDTSKDYVDAEGNTIPYFWYVTRGTDDSTKISIKGKVYDFSDDTLHINDMIAIFGDEYITSTAMSSTIYTWKDEKYNYGFETYSSETDENNPKIKAIHINLR